MSLHVPPHPLALPGTRESRWCLRVPSQASPGGGFAPAVPAPHGMCGSFCSLRRSHPSHPKRASPAHSRAQPAHNGCCKHGDEVVLIIKATL